MARAAAGLIAAGCRMGVVAVVPIVLGEAAGQPGPRSPGGSRPTGGTPRRRRSSWLHLHWYHWAGHDSFSGSSLYSCRCGVVRPGY